MNLALPLTRLHMPAGASDADGLGAEPLRGGGRAGAAAVAGGGLGADVSAPVPAGGVPYRDYLVAKFRDARALDAAHAAATALEGGDDGDL